MIGRARLLGDKGGRMERGWLGEPVAQESSQWLAMLSSRPAE